MMDEVARKRVKATAQVRVTIEIDPEISIDDHLGIDAAMNQAKNAALRRFERLLDGTLPVPTGAKPQGFKYIGDAEVKILISEEE